MQHRTHTSRGPSDQLDLIKARKLASLKRRANRPARGPSTLIPPEREVTFFDSAKRVRLNSRKRRRDRWNARHFEFAQIIEGNQQDFVSFIARMGVFGVSAKNAARVFGKFAAATQDFPAGALEED